MGRRVTSIATIYALLLNVANDHHEAGGELVYAVYKEEQGKDVNPKINVKLEANKS